MKRTVLTSAMLAVLLAAGSALGSTFLAMSTEELVQKADAVIIGQVRDATPSWTRSGRLIVTDFAVNVDDVLVGEAPRTATVRTFGGEVGDFKIEAYGFPTFEVGERVLLYLEAEAGHYRVLGYQQGQFRVVTRRDGVTLAVPMTDTENASYLTRQGRMIPAAHSEKIDAYTQRVLSLARALRPQDTK